MITPGSWPDWIAAIFTSLAFLVAAVSYARSVKIRREAQARLVYSKVTHVEHHQVGTEYDLLPRGARMGSATEGMTIVPSASSGRSRGRALAPLIQVTAVIHNGSQELIGPAKVQMVNTGRHCIYDTFSIVVNTIDPDSDLVVDFTFPNADHPAEPGLGTTVIFRDASGRWWRRHLSEPIEAVHNDPENAAATPAERATYAANARALGYEPTPEPAVRRTVRWHRYWRRRRGKSPIP